MSLQHFTAWRIKLKTHFIGLLEASGKDTGLGNCVCLWVGGADMLQSCMWIGSLW